MTENAKGPQEESLRILGDAEDASARTFVFRDEDHTLGNALRHVLMRQRVPPRPRNERNLRTPPRTPTAARTRISRATRCLTRASRS